MVEQLKRNLLAKVLVVSLAAVLAACGSGGEEDPPVLPEEIELQQIAAECLNAIEAADALIGASGDLFGSMSSGFLMSADMVEATASRDVARMSELAHDMDELRLVIVGQNDVLSEVGDDYAAAVECRQSVGWVRADP